MAKNSQNPINEGYERRDGAQKLLVASLFVLLRHPHHPTPKK